MTADLVAAASKGDAATVVSLVHGVDAAAACEALAAAATAGHGAAMHAIAAAGPKVEAPGELMALAARSGSGEACAVAADFFGAPIDGSGGEPPLLAAAGAAGDALTFLLERGADPNTKGADGVTALHIAAGRKAVDDVKTLVLYGAVPAPCAKGQTPQDLAGGDAALGKELARGRPAPDKAEAMAARFKQQGNKVFAEGEFVKGAKFYTLAIAYDSKNHVLFSNRSACYYNQRKLLRALCDAMHCIRLKPDWAKGYFRKGATLVLLQEYEEAMRTFQCGLKLDPAQKDLIRAKDELAKEMRERGRKAK
eukprot:TRINITY_DN5708_c0_g2_i1.p1 TRINITY_DN5708_c0_g2~~TRINITY_DN5708_c0_g2_i1.p1  ORF type:complete len:309 (+),score=82.50 TRINITY_DN5708_c0_g2_i1:83-1009(+)